MPPRNDPPLPTDRPHRRRNALTGSWVLVSPHRTDRPWLGQTDSPASAPRAAYDPGCYLCPGNARAAGAVNPRYTGAWVFPNDYPALLPDPAPVSYADDPLFGAATVGGECRVVCYSPRHDLSLGELGDGEVAAVVATWCAQWRELDRRDDLAYALIFENRGEMMGASNPHPHGQIWATGVVPDEVEREHAAQSRYRATHGRALLADYLAAELARDERVVATGEHWVALVPYWAVWPFELIVLPRRAVAGFDELASGEQSDLARVLKRVVAIFDGVFDAPFPYSMGWHPRPGDGRVTEGWVLHAHFYPPLLRSATVRKFQVGFEMLGMPQRDLTPEAAAERLKAAAQRVAAGG